MGYATDLIDEQWVLVERVLCAPGKRGRKFQADIRDVVDGISYVAHTGCQWRYLPAGYGEWTRVWSQFRRWSRNGTWARLLAVLHAEALTRAGRAQPRPSLLVVDTHLARGSAKGGPAFLDRGGPYRRTLGAKRVVAVDVTGLPVAALVVPASTHENEANAAFLEQLAGLGVTERLGVVMVDRGMSLKAARSFEKTVDSATGWLQVACVAAVLDALTHPAPAARKRGRGAPKTLVGAPPMLISGSSDVSAAAMANGYVPATRSMFGRRPGSCDS